MDGKRPDPTEISKTEDPKATMDILNYCQVICKTVQRLEKKFDDIDEKVMKIYYSRARSFWRYPPFKAVYRRYNYLMSQRYRLQRLRRFIHDNSVSYPQSYSPTSPVRRRDEDRQNMENTVDYTQNFQYTGSIDNNQAFQYTGSIDNNQAFQYTDFVDDTQTPQYAQFIDNTQASQFADSIDNIQSFQNPESNAVFHSEDFQEVISISSSPERAYQETPLSPIYTAETYQQYYRFRHVPGSSTMTCSNEFENTNLDAITSAISTVREANTLPPGELIPIRNPEMRQLALQEALHSPVIDPNTFGSSCESNSAVVGHLGNPLNWSVNDVITFLNRLDPPLADQLYPIIKQQDIDGKALLLLDTDVMIKYMKMKVGVAMKLDNYIRKLKDGVNCDQ